MGIAYNIYRLTFIAKTGNITRVELYLAVNWVCVCMEYRDGKQTTTFNGREFFLLQ
jgi:hypothetical protein